jgi:large subunit ribosomal protein L32
MGVPKKHTTKSSRNQRRMHIFLRAQKLVPCSHCGKPKLPHVICPNCGYYKGVEVINVLAKLETKEIKEKEKGGERGEGKEKPLTLEELSKKKF